MHHIRRLFASAGLLAACAALVAACGGGSDNSSNSSASSGGSGGSGGKQFVIGYSQSNNAEPYRAQLNLQLEYYAKQHKDLKLLPITDAHQDSSTQVRQVQNFINQKVDVLIVSPNEPGPLTAPVEQACAQHIPVIILDRSVNTQCYTSFIGGDNLAIGRKAGQEAVKLLPNGGNVVELQGILSDTPQIDRDKGFREGIAGHSNIKIVAHREAKWLKESATPIMQQWLQQYPKLDLVYAENDPMALGAYLAAAGAHRADKMHFIGTDGLAIPDGGIRAVEQGQLDATFIYPTAAKEAVDTAEAIVNKQPVKKRWVLGTTQVTKQNAAQLYKQYDFADKLKQG
jgi:ribose transport system substrate-binding protein